MKTPGAFWLIMCPIVLFGAAAASAADENIKFTSPDKHFAMRISSAEDSDTGDLKIELIDKASGKVVVDLGNAYRSHLDETVLLWSTDSKRFAYGTRGDKEGETTVYFWKGSDFEVVPLPEDLPAPDIKFRKGDDSGVKNYGGAVAPVRWLKSGELELSSDSVMMSRESGRTYTGTIHITIKFDAQHHASIASLSKTKTTVE
jgi:hypothetical protein